MDKARIIPFPGTDSPEPHVEAAEPRLDVSDLSRPLCQLNVFRLREESWMPHLSDPENRLLGFILRKTVGWQKTTETFTLTYLAQAVARDKQSVRRALRALAERRGERGAALLTVHEAPDPNTGFTITVNVNWKPKAMPLAIPKRPRPTRGGIESDTPGGIKSDTPRGIESDTQEETPVSYTQESHTHTSGPAARPMLATPKRKREESGKKEVPSADSPENPRAIPESAPGFNQPSLFAAVDTAEQAVKARATVSHDIARQKATPDALERTWRLAWAERHRDMPGSLPPAWTGVDRAKVKKTLCALPMPPAELHDMIEWFVRDYDAIIGTHFRSLKTPAPPLPNVSFVVALGKWVWGAWTRSRQQDFASTLPDRDRAEYIRLTREGRMTHEEAIAAVTEQKVLRGEFARLEAEKVDVARQRRIAERAAERPAFTADRPHPGSIAAARAARGGTSVDDIEAALARVDWKGGR